MHSPLPQSHWQPWSPQQAFWHTRLLVISEQGADSFGAQSWPNQTQSGLSSDCCVCLHNFLFFICPLQYAIAVTGGPPAFLLQKPPLDGSQPGIFLHIFFLRYAQSYVSSGPASSFRQMQVIL